MPLSRPARPLSAALALATTATACLASPVLAQASSAPRATVAATPVVSVDLVVLVLDDGQPMVRAILDRLRSQGVKTQVVSLTDGGRPAIDAAFLATTDAEGPRAKFSGIVLPSEMPTGLGDAERQALSAYEQAYGVREVDAYNWANPAVGLNYAANPGYIGAVDGMKATVTAAAKSGSFGYLDGTVPIDDIDPAVQESWGYLATPLSTMPAGSSFTPLVTATIPGTSTDGSLVGVFKQGNREQLVMTFAANGSQQHFRDLAPGIVDWVTRGVATSYWRSFFSVHTDDTFMADAAWSIDGKCTIGDGCDPTKYPETAPGATSRMVPEDVTFLKDWQQKNNLKIDQAFNGGGSDEHVAKHGSDPLLTAFTSDVKAFRWINHTYDHPYLGCVQEYSTDPWHCAKDVFGNIKYASLSTIQTAISKNITWAATHGIPITKTELVTGEHSGLKTLPQMSVDNPNLAAALTLTGIKWVASDASREAATRTIGSATTVPRHPMNVFYNTSTRAEAVSEYNWMYTSSADGGSGSCTAHPENSTCIKPIEGPDGYDRYIVPLETRIALSHITSNDPRPHYAHQSNLTNDRLLYPVLDRTLEAYRARFADNAPIVNPSQTEAGQALVNQEQWAKNSAAVTVRLEGSKIIVRNTSSRRIPVPFTVPAGTTLTGGQVGESYAGARSGWASLGAWGTLEATLPQAPGFTTPTPTDVVVVPQGAASAPTTRVATERPAADKKKLVDVISRNPAGPTTKPSRPAPKPRAVLPSKRWFDIYLAPRPKRSAR